MRKITKDQIFDKNGFNNLMKVIVLDPNRALPTSEKLVVNHFIDCKRCGASKLKNKQCEYCGM